MASEMGISLTSSGYAPGRWSTAPCAVGAVLLYRIITFKILVTGAWVGYQYLHDHARGGTR